MKSEEIKAEIAAVQKKFAPLQAELNALRSKLSDELSKEWIAANRVTRADVQFSHGEGVPWFGDVFKFAKWVGSFNSPKRWCEWNGWLYSTAELLAGRMDRDPAGLAEHLPEAPC